MFWITLLIIHGLAALFLLGAVTHQAVSSVWRSRSRNFVGRFASVQSRAFVNAITAIYLITFFLGGWLYTEYRYQIKPVLEAMGMEWQIGLFELKEHLAAIGLLLLPAYWAAWTAQDHEQRGARVGLTLLVASAAWLSFLTGHILNNLRGF